MELGDLVRNQLTECRRLGVRLELGVGVWAGLVEEKRPDAVVVATGAEPARPWWAPPEAEQVLDVRHVLDGSASGGGPAAGDTVVVIDEIGFHHATSVAELLADRGCQVEVVTNGMVVGQDLGITLDMEGWWAQRRPRASCSRRTSCPWASTAGRSTCSTIRPVTCRTGRRTGWSSRSPPPRSSGSSTSSRERGLVVERIGDCVAPRAHAAVIDGERGGGAVIALVPVRDGEAADGGGDDRGVRGGRRRGG